MKENLNIYYDKKGDYLELRIGKKQKSYFNELENDIFERRSEKNGKIIGISIFNFKKRNKINLKLPLIIKN